MADQVQIIAVDDFVIVNGKGRKVDCSALIKERIRVVQWDGSQGHVEFANRVFDPSDPKGSTRDFKGNERLKNLDRFEKILETWRATPDPEPPKLPDLPNPFEPILARLDELGARLDRLEKKARSR